MARGMPTLVRISVWVAPRLRSTSRISGSMVASPVATFTTMGKKLMTKAVMTAGREAPATPINQDRHQRHLGDGVEGDQQRVEARIDERRGADRQPQQQAARDRQQEA